MKITAGITAYYKEKDKWHQIEAEDAPVYIAQGFEVDHELYICAIGDAPFSERVLKTCRFKKTNTAGRNISFMDTTFQYRELTDEIVCLNLIIEI